MVHANLLQKCFEGLTDREVLEARDRIIQGMRAIFRDLAESDPSHLELYEMECMVQCATVTREAEVRRCELMWRRSE